MHSSRKGTDILHGFSKVEAEKVIELELNKPFNKAQAAEFVLDHQTIGRINRFKKVTMNESFGFVENPNLTSMTRSSLGLCIYVT